MSVQPQQQMPLKLRDDLLFSHQFYANQNCYLLEDPVNAAYFQIGLPEYDFIRYLNGQRSVEEASIASNSKLDDSAVQTLIQWLLQSQLLMLQDEKTGQWRLPPAAENSLQKTTQKFNFLFLKLPLGSPNDWLDTLYPWFAWMLGNRFMWIWTLLVISGSYQLITHGSQFAQAANSLLTPYNAIWLLIAWVLIKTIHELFHGLVCKKYGGEVHDAGIFFILFAPLGGYVNAGSSWRFSSKWQRMHVSSAGMFVEVLIAAIASWIWVSTEVGALNYLAYNLIIIAGIGTLLFNANPLMRFDGYYILSDWLNLPNLGTSGQRYLQYLNRHYWQGRDMDLPAWPHMNWIRAYAILSWLWRIFIMITLLYMAAHLWQGAGIIFAAFGLFSWLGVPFLNFMLQTRKLPNASRVYKRVLLLTTLLITTLFILLTQWHLSYTLTAPVVLDYAGATLVKVDTPGFIRHIAVQNGDYVQKDSLLFSLENRSLETELQMIETQIQAQHLKQQQALDEQLLSVYQLEQEKTKELEQKWQQLKQQVEGLKRTAPNSGQVIASDLSSLDNAYGSRGQVLVTIGDPDQLEVHASIAAADVDFFRTKLNQQVSLILARDSKQTHQATLLRVEARASQHINYPMLTPLGGGNLAITQRLDPSNQGKKRNQESAGYVYIQPRFNAILSLPSQLAQDLYSGETGWIRIQSSAQNLWQRLQTWLKARLVLLNAQQL